MFFKKRRTRTLPTDFPNRTSEEFRDELARRMSGVQRHRLLQGFPMAPMMAEAPRSPVLTQAPTSRPMLLGVLPHTFCVPAVKGCGFCTFPHESFNKSLMVPLAMAIANEITQKARTASWSNIAGIYIGGGTANLTPLPALSILLGALTAFRPRDTELTLEGVPRFFTAEQLDLLTGSGLGSVRISMGVQTFSEAWLVKMGRHTIGSPKQVAAAVSLAQARSVGTSIDLLLNLPGQPREDMLADVEHAIALGVDQICLYHLVLREDLKVPWADDPEMLSTLPENAVALDSWRAVRAALLEAGFVQRTLTNFERSAQTADRRFRYEPHSFRPHTCDALGFGPGAISGINFGTQTKPLKWINHATSEAYHASTKERRSPISRIYVYEPFEDALMQLTRGLALLEVPTSAGALATHRAAFDPELQLLEESELLVPVEGGLRLTERGMFYADSVAGLLAWRTVQHRKAVGLNEPAVHPMG